MKWCNRINMFCIDMSFEEIEMCGCDGDCEYCDDRTDV